ncbi:hypothetical protein ACFQ61_18460 [Streptomyces sp. NPDC056500]|uniref:hypothetical protein n=1 Tax=Streptomyces sp. NPDC056500 TaxID=3345840 RepID=UPI0036C25978
MPQTHQHGYLWTGPKQRFDEEALRRRPHPDPPPPGSRLELLNRYREVEAAFHSTDLPPIETANWLLKPPEMIRGTWTEPKEAASWLRERLTDLLPHFEPGSLRNAQQLDEAFNSAAERLGWGGDVSLGLYLERPMFLSLALVTCSPNRAAPDVLCPVR